MRPMLVVLATLLVAACSKNVAPAVSAEAMAIAAAERKAVADTDAARRDAAGSDTARPLATPAAEQTPG